MNPYTKFDVSQFAKEFLTTENQDILRDRIKALLHLLCTGRVHSDTLSVFRNQPPASTSHWIKDRKVLLFTKLLQEPLESANGTLDKIIAGWMEVLYLMVVTEIDTAGTYSTAILEWLRREGLRFGNVRLCRIVVVRTPLTYAQDMISNTSPLHGTIQSLLRQQIGDLTKNGRWIMFLTIDRDEQEQPLFQNYYFHIF